MVGSPYELGALKARLKATVEQQVRTASDVIVKNVNNLTSDRGFLSQIVLVQLRNLVEGLIVWAANSKPAGNFD